MKFNLKVKNTTSGKSISIHIYPDSKIPQKLNLSKVDKTFIQNKIEQNQELIGLTNNSLEIFFLFPNKSIIGPSGMENLRRKGHEFSQVLRQGKVKSVELIFNDYTPAQSIAFLEGLELSGYEFTKYKSKPDKELSIEATVIHKTLKTKEVRELLNISYGVKVTKDLINEPVVYMTATKLSESIVKLGKTCGFKTEIFNKKKIEALKMGGLLAVNLGSVLPPTFTVLEYKPKNAINKKPIVLVGKGVVYDTGGLSLKPTPNSMDLMKSDMSGAAVVAGTFCAVASNQLPLYMIGLIPATDNRPGGNAITPGDVITISDGTTVEVLNTDAEGRLILADALHYAKKYKPELVIDLATLTGSAARAIGKEAAVMMGTADEQEKNTLIKSGFETWERMVEFPLWEEYGKQIISDIADLKNLGGDEAGAITAGKFLEHFTDYPWIHLDIAGTAFVKTPDSYRGKNATGYGVRLLYHFLKLKATRNGNKRK